MKKPTEIKIDKGIPIPPTGNGRGFAGMVKQLGVGDSVLLPLGMKANNVTYYGRMHGVKLVSRKEASGRFRVWRSA